MKSYEAIQTAIAGKTVEHAKRLHKSSSLINKWQEPSTDYTDSGSHNPLDRIETIIETALALGIPFEDATAPIKYLEEHFGIVGVKIQPVCLAMNELSLDLLKSIEEFGHLAQEASVAMADGKITREEYKRIDQEAWHVIRQVMMFLIKAKEAVR